MRHLTKVRRENLDEKDKSETDWIAVESFWTYKFYICHTGVSFLSLSLQRVQNIF